MPKLLILIVSIGLMVQWCNGLIISPALAYDLTQTATVSATATVPATTPTTSDTTAPTIPILISPVDGAVTRDNRTEFIWRQSTDDNSNTIVYTLYLNGVATYLGISGSGNSSGAGYTARLDNNQIILHPTVSLADGNYNWYVTASDLSGNTSHSTTWNLTIDTIAPYIAITDIDVFHHLELNSDHPEDFAGLNFDIPGPKDIYFTIHTEPWSTITLQFFDQDNQLVAQSSWPVNGSGLIYPYQYLGLGTYQVAISAFDHGGNTTALPNIGLTITQAQITIPAVPGITSPISIPYTPYSLPSLPATVAQLSTTYNLSPLTYIMLAIAILLLPILFWRRRYNLILLNPDFSPIHDATIYHAIPTRSHIPGVKGAHTPGMSTIYVTNKQPMTYHLTSSQRGRLRISHLTRYSTLTIITNPAGAEHDSRTYLLSLSAKARLYTIILG